MDGQADSEGLAAYAVHPASELRVLPRGTDGLVRKTRGELRLGFAGNQRLRRKIAKKCATPRKNNSAPADPHACADSHPLD